MPNEVTQKRGESHYLPPFRLAYLPDGWTIREARTAVAFGLFSYNMQITIPDAVAPAVAAACLATAAEITVSSQRCSNGLEAKVRSLEAENLRLVAVLIGVQLSQTPK